MWVESDLLQSKSFETTLCIKHSQNDKKVSCRIPPGALVKEKVYRISCHQIINPDVSEFFIRPSGCISECSSKEESLETLLQDFTDVSGLAHSVEMYGRHSVCDKVLALVDRP